MISAARIAVKYALSFGLTKVYKAVLMGACLEDSIESRAVTPFILLFSRENKSTYSLC
jgi:hypothetical protein